MLATTASLAGHIEAVIASHRPLRAEARGPSSIAVIGMGGSRVAGEVLQALALKRSRVPVTLVNGYEAPAFCSSETLVFSVSFSGDTEETLAATSSALAAHSGVVAITSGGALAKLVEGAGGSVLAIDGSIPQPRAAIGAMVAALLLACEDLGLLDGMARELELSIEQLHRRQPELAAGEGVSLEIARRIGRTIPLVHGADGLGAVAAKRWKTQVNENAKSPAFDSSVPEVCHNEVCGFGQNGDVTRQLLTLVQLRLGEGYENERVGRRFALLAEMVDEAVGDIVEVVAEGGCELARFFDLVTIGDFVSLQMAASEGTDPGPVPVLGEIKRRLARA
ncbi:MAG: SIS domain-containing protein [Acidimicrobiales bacterium]